jgi:hypothetical protein
MWTAYTGPAGLLGAIRDVIRVTPSNACKAGKFTPERLRGGRKPSRSVCDFVDLAAIRV